MKKIEEVTCIKFENRTKNHHKERVLELYKISLELIFMMRLKEESLSSQAVVFPELGPQKRTTFDFVLDSDVIQMSDEMVDNKILVYFQNVLRNTH